MAVHPLARAREPLFRVEGVTGSQKDFAALVVTLVVRYMAYGELPKVLEAQKRSKSGASALEASPGGSRAHPATPSVPLGRSTRLSEKTA